MPQPHIPQDSDGFDTPTQLSRTSSNSRDLFYVDQSSDAAGRLSSLLESELLDLDIVSKTWVSGVKEPARCETWSSKDSKQGSSPANINVYSREDDHSTCSSPLSPAKIQIKQKPKERRKAQNRVAQRAYRDRKMKYVVELQSGIQEIEQKISCLQTENTGLIQELCETRAENHDLRTSTTHERDCLPAHRADNRNLCEILKFAVPDTSSSRKENNGSDLLLGILRDKAGGEILESLYEPFKAMWNLIQLDPLVVHGQFSAPEVLDSLSRMVEVGQMKQGSTRIIPPSQRAPNIPRTAEKLKSDTESHVGEMAEG